MIFFSINLDFIFTRTLCFCGTASAIQSFRMKTFLIHCSQGQVSNSTISALIWWHCHYFHGQKYWGSLVHLENFCSVSFINIIGNIQWYIANSLALTLWLIDWWILFNFKFSLFGFIDLFTGFLIILIFNIAI